MERRTVIALIVASAAFGVVLGWVLAGGRRGLDRGPSAGELSQQMAPGMARRPQTQQAPAQQPELPPDHPPIDQRPWETPEYQQALQEQLEKVQKNPNDIRAWRDLGKLYAFGQQNDKAIEAYQKALQLAPNDLDAKGELGLVYLNQAQFAQADRLADEILAVAPDHPDALFIKGTTLAMLHGDRESAVATYKRFLEKYPNHQMAGFIRQLIQQMEQRRQARP